MGTFDYVHVCAPLQLTCSDEHELDGQEFQTKDLGCNMGSWTLGATLELISGDVDDEIELPFTGKIAIYTECLACPVLFDELENGGGNVVVPIVELEVELEKGLVLRVERTSEPTSEQLSSWIERYGAEGPMAYADAVAMRTSHVPNRERSLWRFLTKLNGRWRAHPGDVELLSRLIQQDPALVSARDADRQTPLHHLIDKIRPDSSNAEIAIFEALAELVLQKGADPDAKDKNGNTPLFFASTPRAVVFLVQRGAHINTANNRGNTPLMHAVHDRELFESLLMLGADPHQTNLTGESAHTWALLAQNDPLASPRRQSH